MKTAKPNSLTDTYPMRINKYLAHKGIATRAGVDELITRGKVTINGRKAFKFRVTEEELIKKLKA